MDWSGFIGSAGKSIGGFLSARREAKAANAVRKRQNENAAVIAAHNHGVISQHRAAIREETTSARVKIQRARMKALASARVSAAAAGVAGGSVEAGEYQVLRSAAERAHELTGRAEAGIAKTFQDEHQNRVNQAMQVKTMLSGPSVSGLLFNLGADYVDARAGDTGSDGTGQ